MVVDEIKSSDIHLFKILVDRLTCKVSYGLFLCHWCCPFE